MIIHFYIHVSIENVIGCSSKVSKQWQVSGVSSYLSIASLWGSCQWTDRSVERTGVVQPKRDMILLNCSINSCNCSENVWPPGHKLESVCSNSCRCFVKTSSLAGSILTRLSSNIEVQKKIQVNVSNPQSKQNHVKLTSNEQAGIRQSPKLKGLHPLIRQGRWKMCKLNLLIKGFWECWVSLCRWYRKGKCDPFPPTTKNGLD